ncbi:hypothetical protein JMJ77_0014677 [Colletotrichum scovillei]|uniref:Uncharacterized protein n=1 Tax=Colletotrichum scovillei TaxID=1209932 RepID=A0A9P7UC59_9PEZI|nr:hypothetical protein JMJ77_0014677 [Colletotrichum scovillei]KAG7056285.1 hypothetical protein JMJ78_0000088 [Colletotrichum scovillei]KAG7066216.1 hypothetical protein JMJ76_0000082 [Colletotrichum scovillei]
MSRMEWFSCSLRLKQSRWSLREYNMAAHDLSPRTQGVDAQSSFLAKPASGQSQKKIYDGESQLLTPSWGGVVRVATCST